jgi:hypothetical protein
LTGGNVVFPAVETRAFRQSGNCVFADRVRGCVCEVLALTADDPELTYLVSEHRPRYYNKSAPSPLAAAMNLDLPSIIDNPPTLRFLLLHQPRSILRTKHSGRDIDIHDREEILDVEVFEGDGFA